MVSMGRGRKRIYNSEEERKRAKIEQQKSFNRAIEAVMFTAKHIVSRWITTKKKLNIKLDGELASLLLDR